MLVDADDCCAAMHCSKLLWLLRKRRVMVTMDLGRCGLPLEFNAFCRTLTAGRRGELLLTVSMLCVREPGHTQLLC